VVDGHKQFTRAIAFSPDSRWLATSWADGRLRLWSVPGGDAARVRVLATPLLDDLKSLAFDPLGRYLFAVGNYDNAWIVPLDGSPGRKLPAYSPDILLTAAAVSPTGRRVATAFGYGKGPRTLRVWDAAAAVLHLFDLPDPPSPPGSPPFAPTGYEAGVLGLAFLDDSTLYTAGHGGIRRWNLDAGTHEIVKAFPPNHTGQMGMSSDRSEILFCHQALSDRALGACGVLDIRRGATRSIVGCGEPPLGLVAQGPALAATSGDDIVRVGLRSGGEPHLLLGHAGAADGVAISPDLRWVASTGEDGTLRLWPMPDLSKPRLHTLPHDELLAKLKSLTNLRAVRDAKSATGWSIELGPFPGWRNIPAW
jgi:WD40 repeat protein